MADSVLDHGTVTWKDFFPHQGLSWRDRLIGKILCLDKVNQVYRQIDKNGGPRRFLQGLLEALEITYHCHEKDILSIPASGPVIVVANHPFGAIEGIILADIFVSRRQEVKILANHLLAAIQELHDLFIFIDPFQQNDAVPKNIGPLRSALKWLQRGGLLAVFPAGEVAHRQWRQRKIADPPWQESVAWLIRKSGAAVVPVYFHGANSLLFQILGLVHPRLRTAMLPRKLFNKKGQAIELRIGNAIPYLKMGGKILGFNRDPDFNNALDVFIVVDLLNSPRKLIELYFGKEGAETFYSYHQAIKPINEKGKIFANTTMQPIWNS